MNASPVKGSVRRFGAVLCALSACGAAGSAARAADCALCDLNHNLAVESSDLETFVACLAGPAVVPLAAPCAFADLDGDGDGDQDDFGLFQPCLGRDLSPSTVFLSEILAANNRNLADQDGEFSDWIELYNSGGQPVNLSGWYLTDNRNLPTQWRFPSTSIGAGQHLLVFASEKNRAVAGAELHTNFKLDAEGEYVALIKPDGVSVASDLGASFPRQREDISYGVRGAATPGSIQLVAPGAAATYLVPSADLGLSWTSVDYPDQSWTSAHTGIGYERSSAGTYDPLIAPDGDVETLIYDQSKFSIYIRIPFTVEAPVAVSKLELWMKYDDAFVAYLNGDLVAKSPNAPASPGWNSRATEGHDANPQVYLDKYDITALGALRVGQNVLAIHGMNYSSNDRDLSSDLIFMPELWIQGTGGGTYFPGELRYLTPATPRGVNGNGFLGLVEDTKFDVDRGFYDAPFQVAITTATPGATIRYTTNGSAPAETTGSVYSGPITISTTTTLRAAAFKPGHLPSDVDTQTYLFLNDVIRQPNNPSGFPAAWCGAVTGDGCGDGPAGGNLPGDYELDPDIINSAKYSGRVMTGLTSLPTLSLVTDIKHWWDPVTGIYMNCSAEGVAWERPVSVELIYPDGTPGFQVNAGVRIQGGTSPIDFKSPKLSMRLLFKDIYGPDKLRFPLFPDSPVTEFNQLILDAHLFAWIHPWDEAQRRQTDYVRDTFMSDLQRASGWPAAHDVYAHLYLNGIYWGLYDVHEKPDEDFCADYYGGASEDYDVIKHRVGTVVSGDNVSYIAMMNLAAGGLAGNAAYEQLIQQYLDVDAFIDYMIANFYGGNTDWAHQNWYVSRSRQPGGLFRYVSWDAEHVLKDLNYNATTDNDGQNTPTWLHQQLRANAEYKMRFADHVHKHFFNGGILYTDPANPTWNPARPERNRPAALYVNRATQIDTAVILESARWGDYRPNPDRPGMPYERDIEWINEQNRLRSSYFTGRAATVLQQLRNTGCYPTVAAPVFNQHGGAYAAGFKLTITGPGAVYFTLDGSDPRLTGGSVNGAASVYSGLITLNGTVRVKARSLSGGVWSALNEALFAPAAPPALRITEVMYHPPAGGAFDREEYEFIELHNLGASPVQLEGVALGGGIDFTFPTMELAGGAFVVVVENPAAFSERYGAGPPVAGQYTRRLSNDTDTLRLSDAVGQVILEFSYLDEWYPLTDGLGHSLTVVNPSADPLTWGDSAQWRASTAVLGSPGESD